MTYAAFLTLFLALPIVVLATAVSRRLRRFHVAAGGLVCAMAIMYTSPWDNYAARRGLWSFAPSFVWGRPLWIGALPLEEYLFYLAEAVFVCLIFVTLSGLPPFAARPDEDHRVAIG